MSNDKEERIIPLAPSGVSPWHHRASLVDGRLTLYWNGSHGSPYAAEDRIRTFTREETASLLDLLYSGRDEILTHDEQSDIDPDVVESTVTALLKELPAHYPPAKFTKEARGYVLEIDRTLIFNGVSGETAIKDTKHYVEARKTSPSLPIGVIYGIYD